MPPYLLGYNLHFLLKKNASFFLHILVVFGDFLKFSCVNSNFEIGGNVLARVQRVHEPTDLWDIAFCTR